jgi:16S rRNA (guanine966-N2)-methyltransferase
VLKAKLPSTVRPTTDRVKESIFDILGSLGGVADLVVVDMFCGSGALGIEALSRGAAHVTFVDADRACLAAAAENLAAVGLDASSATFVHGRIPSVGVPASDLVLADPPYDLVDAAALLDDVDTSTLVLESRVSPSFSAHWAPTRERRYGTTLVTVMTRLRKEGESS